MIFPNKAIDVPFFPYASKLFEGGYNEKSSSEENTFTFPTKLLVCEKKNFKRTWEKWGKIHDKKKCGVHLAFLKNFFWWRVSVTFLSSIFLWRVVEKSPQKCMTFQNLFHENSIENGINGKSTIDMAPHSPPYWIDATEDIRHSIYSLLCGIWWERPHFDYILKVTNW